MRRLAGLAGGGVLLLAAVSCDTTQPVDAGPQVFSVGVTAASRTNIYDIWEEWFDADGNGMIDPNGGIDILLRHDCDQVGAQDELIPWRFSAEVSVIRKGSTQEEIVATSIGTVDIYSNLTSYTEGFFGVPSPRASNPPLYYRNGRRDAGGGRDYLGNCLGNVLDEPNVLGQTPRFELTLNQGDTVVIRVRKQLEADADPDFIQEGLPSMTISGSLEGRAVSLEGSSDTSGDGGGTTQSFTLQ